MPKVSWELERMHKFVNILKNWSISHDNIAGFVLLGSFVRKDVSSTSDLDAVFIKTKHTDITLLSDDLYLYLQNHNINSYFIRSTHKSIFYIKQSLFKLDLTFTNNLHSIARFVLGSEFTSKDVHASVIIDKTLQKTIKSDFISITSKSKSEFNMHEYNIQYSLSNFIEYFDNASRDAINKDQYRFEFHLFLLRHSIIVMYEIINGVLQHLYLPKYSFEKWNKDELSLKLQELPLRVESFPFHSDDFNLRFSVIIDILQQYLIVFRCIHQLLQSYDLNLYVQSNEYANKLLPAIIERMKRMKTDLKDQSEIKETLNIMPSKL